MKNGKIIYEYNYGFCEGYCNKTEYVLNLYEKELLPVLLIDA